LEINRDRDKKTLRRDHEPQGGEIPKEVGVVLVLAFVWRSEDRNRLLDGRVVVVNQNVDDRNKIAR